MGAMDDEATPPTTFEVAIPGPDNLDAIERESAERFAGWPVRIHFRDVESAVAVLGRRVRQRENTQRSVTASPQDYIDQRSGLVPRDLYLRLAREGSFPSRKIGKRIVARWADVEQALAPPPRIANASDEADVLREALGLVAKGGR